MKVGTDGVLLGAWAHGGQHILDIGAGTGLISMMMAQRFPSADVDGVEIDVEAARQAQENAASFSSHIHVFGVSMQQFKPSSTYDSMVTNPPFFLDSLKSPEARRSMARHADSLPFDALFQFAAQWLTPTGELSAIIPIAVLERFSATAYLSGFRMSRKVMIKTTLRKPFKRCLIAFSRHLSAPYEEESHHLQNDDGSRSEWYQELTKDFYIT